MTITDETGIPPGGTGRTLPGPGPGQDPPLEAAYVPALADHRLIRPVWNALVAYGSMWLGGVDYTVDGTPVPRWPAAPDAADRAPGGLRAS
ncbi:hypothetical protein ACIBI4_22495 [Streptomyces sp. NPDC050418]|uniref:hypothetical protein n=1 Tax=Streptomyces sp. NPDC050418 TaxID=3365612 RepID=UPI0037B80448